MLLQWHHCKGLFSTCTFKCVLLSFYYSVPGAQLLGTVHVTRSYKPNYNFWLPAHLLALVWILMENRVTLPVVIKLGMSGLLEPPIFSFMGNALRNESFLEVQCSEKTGLSSV